MFKKRKTPAELAADLIDGYSVMAEAFGGMRQQLIAQGFQEQIAEEIVLESFRQSGQQPQPTEEDDQ